MILRRLALGAIGATALLVSASQPLLAQGAPAQGQAAVPAGEGDLQAAIAKSNAYTQLMNRTLRANESWQRYASWVDMKKGPTGKERYIAYGLYSLYDVTGEIRKAEEAAAREPKLPEIDAAVLRYIKAYQELAPLITRPSAITTARTTATTMWPRAGRCMPRWCRRPRPSSTSGPSSTR